MSEHVTVHNPNAVPVDVPGYGLLGAGQEVAVVRSGALRRAIEYGRVATGAIPVDYDSQTPEALAAEAARRDLQVNGTGKDGNVLKADLLAALTTDDERRNGA